MSETGSLIARRYLLERVVGEGGYGRVYKGLDVQSGRELALKALLREVEQALRGEVAILTRLGSSPYILPVLEMVREEKTVYLVMEFMRRGSLEGFLSTHGRPEIDQTFLWTQELLRGLAQIHGAGIIHRDIKPPNALLSEDGHIRISDFGVARAMESTGFVSTQVGTMSYMAPEVITGRYDQRVDVYSAGTSFYRLLGGQFPMDLESLPEDVPPGFRGLISQATSPEKKRFRGGQEMLAALEAKAAEHLRGLRQERLGKVPAKVLVVGAESELRERVASSLRGAGYHPLVAGNAEEALFRLAWGRPHVALLAAESLGAGFLEKMRKRFPEVGLLALGEAPDRRSTEEALAFGVRDFLPPEDWEAIERSVAMEVALLERRQRRLWGRIFAGQ